MEQLNAGQVHAALPFQRLVPALRQAFTEGATVPLRHHHDMAHPGHRETTLLLMPAWQDGDKAGVKVVTVAPHNTDLPSIQGIYLLLDLPTGTPELMMDAPALTARRTAAASALAASYLAPVHAETLLMVGTGTLAPLLIEAHSSVRPIKRVRLWGRNPEKAAGLIAQLDHLDLQFEVVTDLEKAASDADIISVATLSQTPLLKGEWLRPGQHVDLVGAYRPDMREADDDVVRRCQIYVDSREGALKETGDLAIPLAQGVITPDDIHATLFELCQQQHNGRTDPQALTLFKSVGHALEDLAAAREVERHWKEQA
ncbi:ornithine cyclodeaminase family protein [Ferrimonas balearica]|uniref:ornithine cyclodeaminase family protein n=1 Tax=Ferrimonas balearica TaxID=44012 RepID=UPI001C9A1280|nr:ornithine cyclodeaminase family protein [Ferrimonas balearica]MBY5922333.1 ornithine cyclodeaminase family protein [Ferrimonas balearica]MBY5994327.1 ornithine cyclodeaminase family protein [Ferrimonas balearica]